MTQYDQKKRQKKYEKKKRNMKKKETWQKKSYLILINIIISKYIPRDQIYSETIII